jgi:eukaryotic-like serine/threonine-protein kinase
MGPEATQMFGADWERIGALFQRATLLPPEQRYRFIYEETADEPQVRAELLALLAYDRTRGNGPLSRAVGGALVDVIQDNRRAFLGRVVGSYKLIAILGEGGTGTVYLGERADHQYSAQVAVKIIDYAAVQGSFGERFRAERQILASLNHPNIARLLDAGETDDGQPYLIMEHVQGEPVDQYCDRKQLSLERRLRLFTQICSAVQYAHQNLIVHRDLKPANIMVSEEGVPKLLDFGIAKLLDAGESARTPELTRINDRLLTPEYASPEQILGGMITTASDVYSLGVVLYQLVCGLRPYKVPASASQLELERSICISDPDRPSTAVRRAEKSEYPIDAIADARGATVERLARQLHGDIDAVVLRALRKEPHHRYGSVEQLSADIERYLNHEGVQAAQGNWLYYGRRFARRHALGVAAGSAFLVFVIGVAIVMSIQRQQIASALERATQQGQRAETVSDFMLDVFTAADPFVHFGKEPTARNLLDQAARRIQVDLSQQPEVRARLLEAIGGSYRRMGQPERAIPYLQEAVQIQRSIQSQDVRLGSLLAELAIAQREIARYEESDRTFSEALEFVLRSDEKQSEAHAQLLVDLGRLEMVRSNTEQAAQYLHSALDLMRKLRGSRDPEVASILSDLANVQMWRNDLGQAEATARAAVDIYAGTPSTHPDRIMADSLLAQILLYTGQIDESSRIFERVLSAQRFVYGSDNPVVAESLGNLAQVRVARAEYDKAETLIREALTIHRDGDSAAGHRIGYLQTMLGTVLLKKQEYQEAETVIREALDLFSTALPADHQYVASAEYYLGEALLGQQKFADAEAVLSASMNRWKRSDAPSWRAARSKNTLGEVLASQGRIKEGEQYLTETFRELASDPGADQDAKDRARHRIERFFVDRGQRAKFDQLMQEQNAHVANIR